MPGVRALIVTPLGVSEREDNNPVPPGVRGIRPQSRFILPTVALKSILPKRARVSLAAEAGGVLGNANDTSIAQMRCYGRETGMAFQIVDDVLDFIGTADRLGKPVGNDLQQGLLTLPALNFIEANPDDPDVAALLNGHRKDRKMREHLLQSIRASDAIEASLDKARDFVTSAKSALSAATEDKNQNILHAIADYVVEREF